MNTEPPRPRATIPASVAWKPGDPVGDRQFFSFADERPFVLEHGGSLRSITIAYETWGTLDDDCSNAILVCHALTGDSHATGDMGPAHPTPGWWSDFIGPGKALDTDRFFVVCANVLGGCQGSTGPASLDPRSGQPYGSSFPVVTIRDIVRTQARLADSLGIDTWYQVIGGSMGGMQVLEWAIMFPDRLRSITCLAATLGATAQQIAWSALGRNALVLDPKWRGGNYYHAVPGDGPHAGLAAARGVAQVTYRTDEVFQQRFAREPADSLDGFGLWGQFQVESYLDHHGIKLARRFDANSYLILNRAMDLHDVGRGRNGYLNAVKRIKVPSLVVSISSDALYFPWQQEELVAALKATDQVCHYEVVQSRQGHDGFLLESDLISPRVAKFLADIAF
ncbi:MAG: homoserine O-acetyltransferase [Acidimicrobiales bacterium]